MNTIREIEKINQEELDRGIAGTPASWHAQYAKAPWVYVGNLDHELTEGDVLSVMSQFGEVRFQRLECANVVCCAFHSSATQALSLLKPVIGPRLSPLAVV
jgi:hypothetical protein